MLDQNIKLLLLKYLPWTVPPYGYLLDPECPRDPNRLRLDPVKAAVVTHIFAWDTEPQMSSTLYGVAKRLSDAQLPTPMGKPRWNASSVRGILCNPVYTGIAHSGKSHPVPRACANPPCDRWGRVSAIGLRPPKTGCPSLSLP